MSGVVIGSLAALEGALIGAVASGAGGRRRSPGRRLPPWPQVLGALALAGSAGAAIGRTTQRWTWSGDRVSDQLLDAELALWDETETQGG